MKKIALLFFISILIVLVFVGCKSKDNVNTTNNNVESNSNKPDDNNDKSKGDNEEENPFNLDFNLTDIDGNTVNLSEYKGKPLFLNFFVTWCGPCMNEMPEFEAFYNLNKDDVEIIIVNVNFDPNEKSIEDVVSWYKESNLSFPMLIDKDGSTTKNLLPYVQGYPTTFVFNKEGKSIGYISGGLTQETMNNIMDKYFAE